MPADATLWRDYVPAGYVPSESMIFMGANPAWSPKREGRILDDAGNATAAHPRTDPKVCPDCGEDMQARLGSDPIRLFETAVVACARCFRSTYEGKLRGKLDRSAGDVEEADRHDDQDRTGAAVADHAAGQPEPARPLTRREKRREKFGDPSREV